MIVSATTRDLQDILRLLETCGLPTADLSPALLEGFLVQRQAGGLQGVVGLQIFERVGMLRSLAVLAERRGRGWGEQLTRQAEELARKRGVGELYLLTTTAEGFFTRLGYQAIAREQAPLAIQNSAEFQSLCPASAVLMRKNLF
ncbi:MAG TPA: arsenic resistance N-acetyltransferase ArsN2 [Anaerolineales bacterium]|nr:arsenic resistance N-acetyltransferase ArsN2 [Anaerolineales bacterium]